ncbi:hypothetical protein MMC10_002515 [Thelotrema lepadinum]|nr:hypothetical protein [Thelotrema lepadinum]
MCYSAARPTITIQDQEYPIDTWTNVPSRILEFLPRQLHLQPSHPLGITRQLIESRFPSPLYSHHNDISPVVTTRQNFDSLGFPDNHPGRSKTDTYYVNSATCLRTHTSAHQADIFRSNASDGFTITADVYRRDAIDRSHYPVFHQTEGARLWDRKNLTNGFKAIQSEVHKFSEIDLLVADPNPTIHPLRNPLQPEHSVEEVEAVAAHLKRSLEDLVSAIFDRARTIVDPLAPPDTQESLQVRWVEAYFPFTSPSWELEVLWQGEWLEILGCGIVKQSILNACGVPEKIGWAFGMGLERVAMLLYSIPDIRLFWSQDDRFLSQFATDKPVRQFVPFSKYPSCPRDVAFWTRETGSGGATSFHENDAMQVIRDIGGDLVEQVQLVDEFQHPKSGRKSFCYNISYRSLERVISRDEANNLHEEVRSGLVSKLGVELR